MKDEIMVSICCITYNHEKFIREALEGFLMQKTNFKYEIIIHDDASTDNTANIIREYEEKYPDIVKPIYQKENQYSKGVEISSITFEKTKGKYIALCEGDDYWTDENKLQIQVEYMENNPNCTFCFHDAYVLNMKNNKKEEWKWYNKKVWKKEGNYNAGELDLLDFIPTASFIFRKKHIKNLPEWYEKCVVGDRPLKLITTSFGYAHYIDRTMSIYRVESGNSAMDIIKKQNQNPEKAIEYFKKIEWFIDKFNTFSDFKYDKELNFSKDNIQFNILMVKKDYKKIIKQKRYRRFLNNRTKVILLLKVYVPFIYKVLKDIKNKIKKED